jgi:DNA helicase II / ATP-dependent DNA helicase PcrA
MKTIELDTDQQEVLESTATHKLVISGPGSGKTRTLIAAIEQEASEHGPSGVVAITFTNSAALEIESRLKELGIVGLGFVGTLHAFLLRLLREYGERIGLPHSLSVIDDEQKQGMVETVMQEMGIKLPVSKIMAVVDSIFDSHDVKGASLDKAQLVSMQYHATLLASGAMDFASILYWGEKLIRYLAAKKDWPYKFLGYDEIQDCSEQDWRIMQAMPCERKYLTGDSDQAIFQFRKGDPKQMVALFDEAEHPKKKSKWKAFTLETNYRCAGLICSHANRLIEWNLNRVEKYTLSTRQEAGRISVHACENEVAEMNLVLGYIGAYLKNNSPDTVAILSRTNRLASDFSDFLLANGVPVKKRRYAGVPADWRKAKLLLSVLSNPWNDLAVQEYLTVNSTKQTAAIEKQKAATKMVSINESMGFPFGKGDPSVDADLGKHGLSFESKERIHDACRELGKRGTWDINDLILYLNGNEQWNQEDGEGVTVTTVHQAKGKEFETVFVVGLEEGLFPQLKKETDMEEERRLAFVSFTRAKDRLILTWARQRQAPFGPCVMRPTERSRFIAEAELT